MFKVNRDGTGFLRLHDFDFNGREGSAPHAGLVVGSDGALFGTTALGGANGDGVVFKLNKDGTGFRTLHSFRGPAQGADPDAGLIEGPNGAFYGTTTTGGPHGYGTAFRINKDGSGFRTLHAFNFADGAHAAGELVEGSDGALYGTALDGGTRGGGVLFRLAVPCMASIDVEGDVHAPGSRIPVHVQIAHHRPVTVTVSWQISLIDPAGRVVITRTLPPHTFEPGDVVDKDLLLPLPKDLTAGTYTLRLAIDEMQGTRGSATTVRIVRAE